MGILIGMDEAGYGPNFGPLIVAAAFAVDRIEGGQRLRNKLNGLMSSLSDEKAHTKMMHLFNAELQATNE